MSGKKQCNWSEEEIIWNKDMIIGGKKFDVEHETYVMGILNVTPVPFLMVENIMAWIRQWSMQDRWSRTAQTSLM